MSMKNLFLTIVFSNVLLPSLSWAFIASQGAKLSLSQQGVDLITSELTKKFLREERIIAVPNVETKADYGINVFLEGISATVKIEQIKIVNQEGLLDFALIVKEAQIKIGKIRAKRGTIFGDIGFSCYNTSLRLANQSANPLRAEMIPFVENGQIKLATRNVDFVLRDENFHVQGPRSCSGGPLERFIKDITKNVLKKSREKIQELVKNTIPKASGHFGEELSRLAQQNLNFAFNIPPYFPNLKIEGKTLPQAVNVSQETLFLSFGLQFQELLHEVLLSTRRTLSSNKNLAAPFGSLEIHESLFNQVFTYVFQQKRADLQRLLNVEVVPQMKAFLRRDVLESVLPDLKNINLDTPELKGIISLKSIPEVILKKESSMGFKVPQLTFSLWVGQGGEWRPYFHFNFDLSLTLKTILKNNLLNIEFQSFDSYDVTGNWDAQYHPSDDKFNLEDFQDILEALKEIITFNKPKFALELPNIKLGDHQYLFQEAVLREGSLQLDILFH